MFIVHNMIMIQANINEIKSKLSEYLDKVSSGETVLICNRNVPIAEIKAIVQKTTGRRVLGLAKGKIKIEPAFFDPMTNDELKAWEKN